MAIILSPQAKLRQKHLELAILELCKDHCFEAILETMGQVCKDLAKEEETDPASQRMLSRLGSRLAELSYDMIEF